MPLSKNSNFHILQKAKKAFLNFFSKPKKKQIIITMPLSQPKTATLVNTVLRRKAYHYFNGKDYMNYVLRLSDIERACYKHNPHYHLLYGIRN